MSPPCVIFRLACCFTVLYQIATASVINLSLTNTTDHSVARVVANQTLAAGSENLEEGIGKIADIYDRAVRGTPLVMKIHTYKTKYLPWNDVQDAMTAMRLRTYTQVWDAPIQEYFKEEPHGCEVGIDYTPIQGVRGVVQWGQLYKILLALWAFYKSIEFEIPWVGQLIAVYIDVQQAGVGVVGKIRVYDRIHSNIQNTVETF